MLGPNRPHMPGIVVPHSTRPSLSPSPPHAGVQVSSSTVESGSAPYRRTDSEHGDRDSRAFGVPLPVRGKT
jgi:hypothetical protein